jgi:hypothetical protein
VGLLVVLVLAVVLFLVVLTPIAVMSRRAASTSAASTSTSGAGSGAALEAAECPAVVRRVWETGVVVKNQPRVGMLLSVEPDSGEPFAVEVEQTISRLQAQRIRPGHVVTVRYRRADPSRVVVVSLG